MVPENITCPECKKSNIIKWCKRKTQNRGIIQRYKCKDCGKFFTLDEGFYRMRNSSQKITCALDLFYKGVSTRKIQDHFQAFYPHNSSNKSIYKWIVKYSKRISQYTNSLKLNVGNELQIDEMEYHRRKSRNHKGIDKNWFIDVIDTKTRFMVSSNYVQSRNMNELKQVLRLAKKKTEQQVKTITTDGYMAYPQALRKSFGLNKKTAQSKIKHKQVNASAGEGFNIMIERLHNSVRQLTQNFRGFHGCLESAQNIMKGYEIYYNFCRKHQGINKNPYELAIPKLKEKLSVPNKWLALIELATQNK
jgi:transposase-like protein